MGTIGTVNAVFEADTRTFTSNIEGVGATLGDVAEKSEQTSKRIDKAMQAQEAAARRVLRANEELNRIKPNLGEQEVTAASARVTAAVNLQREAQQQYLRVQKLVRDGNVGESESIRLVTAARLQAESASHEVTAAKIAEANEVRVAAEEEALSQNVVIRAFQRVAIVARESLGEVRARLGETAESAGLEAAGIEGAFAGLGKLFGVGIAASFAASYLDGIAKLEVELGHLSEKTEISVTTLAGLQQVVKETGGEFEPVTIGLVKMQRAQLQAVEGSKQGRLAFQQLGIPLKDLERLSPEQLFFRVGQAIATVKEPAVAANAAIQIFGRGGAALIPIFKRYGDQLQDVTEKTGKQTKVTDESVAAAQRWTEQTARLSAEFRGIMIPVLGLTEAAIKALGSTALIAFAGADAVVDTFQASFRSLLGLVGDAAKVSRDLRFGDFAAAGRDADAASSRFVATWKNSFADVRKEYQRAIELSTPPAALPKKKGAEDADLGDLEGAMTRNAGKAQREADRKQLEAFLQGAEERKAAGNFSIFQENAYWHEKLASLQKGSANYLRVLEKSNEAEKRLGEVLQKSLKPRKTGEDDAFEKDQIRFADEQARRVDALRERAEEAQRKLVERGQLSGIGLAVSHGELSRYEGLVAEAQVRAAAFATELSLVDQRLAEARGLASLPGMQEEILKLEAERAKLKEEADQQAEKDRAAIESNTVGGALLQSLRDFEQQANDTAGLVRRTFEETAQGINQSLAGALTDPARTGYERMLNLKNALSSTFRGIANQGIEFSLGKLESGLLGQFGLDGKGKPTGKVGSEFHVIVKNLEKLTGEAKDKAAAPVNAGLNKIGISTDSNSVVGKIEKLFGLGGGTSPDGKPKGTPADPISVKTADAATAGGFDVSKLFGGSGKGDGSGDGSSDGGSGGGGFFSFLGSLFGGGSNSDSGSGGDSGGGLNLPGFATGGPIPPDMGSFIVGEHGPEILNIGSQAGHVTPNHALRSAGAAGGDTHIHVGGVDARGATDPAMVHKAVYEGISKAAPHIVRAAMKGVREDRLRSPSTAR